MALGRQCRAAVPDATPLYTEYTLLKSLPPLGLSGPYNVYML
jgi:hypothetical protein